MKNPPSRGTGHVGDAEDDAEVAHVPAPLPGRHDVAHDGLGADHQPAGPDALNGPEGDELDHGLGQSGQHGADQEDHDGQLEEALAAVEVAELSPQRRGDAGGQQVGGDHPREVVEPVQVAGDGRERRGHDGLVEGGQGHAHHEGAQDHQDPAVLGARRSSSRPVPSSHQSRASSRSRSRSWAKRPSRSARVDRSPSSQLLQELLEPGPPGPPHPLEVRRPAGVRRILEARRSSGSVWRTTIPSRSSCCTLRVTVGVSTPSISARSVTRSESPPAESLWSRAAPARSSRTPASAGAVRAGGPG